jgi:hypothetical protein
MSTKMYYHRTEGNGQEGPFSREEVLLKIKASPQLEHYVWRPDFGERWMHAWEVEDLKEFGFLDILKAAALSINLKRIGIAAVCLIFGFLLFTFFLYLGVEAREPGSFKTFVIIGSALFLLVWWITIAAIARTVKLEVVNNQKHFPIGELTGFVSRNFPAILLYVPIFLLFIAVFVAAQAVVDLIGSVAGVGPLFFGITFLLPFALSFLAIVILENLFVFPAYIAVEEKGIGGMIKDMFELMRRKGFYVLLCQMVSGLINAALTFLIAVYVFLSLSVTLFLASLIMGSNYWNLMNALPKWLTSFLAGSFPAAEPLWRGLVTGESWVYDVGAFFVLINLVLIFAATFTYSTVYATAAGVMTYLSAREK